MGTRLPRRGRRAGRRVALKLLAPELAQRRAVPAALPARVRARGEPRPSARRADAGVGRGRRHALPRDGVRRRLRPARAAAARGPPRAASARSTSSARSPSALDAAHAAGLVHRDVKPGNILVARSRRRAGLRLRLRPRAARLLGQQPHRRPRLRRHDRLRPAGADRGRHGRRPRRRLLARLRALRVPRRASGRSSARASSSVVFAHLNEPPPRITDAAARAAGGVRRASSRPRSRSRPSRPLLDLRRARTGSPRGVAGQGAGAPATDPAALPRSARHGRPCGRCRRGNHRLN